MLRTTSLAVIAATGLTLPAIAGESTASSSSLTSVHAQELKNLYDAKQAHNILASRGFVNVSVLDRDDDGRWTGIATKDGKTIFVAVALPHVPATSATN